MGDATTWAAWAAAVTSAATLVVTTVVNGRREQRKWARDALTDAFVAFLEASWAHSDAVRRLQDGDPPDLSHIHPFYTEMRSQLTRLRLLAGRDVLDTGEELLRRQRAVQDAPPGDARRAALSEASVCRRRLVSAAKKEMGLP